MATTIEELRAKLYGNTAPRRNSAVMNRIPGRTPGLNIENLISRNFTPMGGRSPGTAPVIPATEFTEEDMTNLEDKLAARDLAANQDNNLSYVSDHYTPTPVFDVGKNRFQNRVERSFTPVGGRSGRLPEETTAMNPEFIQARNENMTAIPRGGVRGENLEPSALSQFRAWFGDRANEITGRGLGGRAGQVDGATLGGVNISPPVDYQPGIDTHPLAALQAGVGTPTSLMANAVEHNPQGLGSRGWNTPGTYAAAGLEPGVVPDNMVAHPRSGYNEWAGLPLSGLSGLEPGVVPDDMVASWATPYDFAASQDFTDLALSDFKGDSPKTRGFTPDWADEPSGWNEATRMPDLSIADPMGGRGLANLTGNYAARYNQGPSWLSKNRSILGLIPGLGLAASLPQSNADRFANLAAAQHYADQSSEGWVNNAFVGNYNPNEGRLGYTNRMGEIDQDEFDLQQSQDRAGGKSLAETIAGIFGGGDQGEEADDGNNWGGWGGSGVGSIW